MNERRYTMPIYKRCGRCGKRMEAGRKCECLKERHKEYDRYSRDKRSKDFYNGSEWEKARADTLNIDENTDVYIFVTTGEIVAADTVHHVEPLKDAWEKRIDIDNLMALHHDTHSRIEKMYKGNKEEAIETMKKILKEYRSGGGAV